LDWRNCINNYIDVYSSEMLIKEIKRNMNKFMVFDKVNYVGEKFRGDLKNRIGVIAARVQLTQDSYVVDYGEDAFVLPGQVLTHWRAANSDEASKADNDIYRRRRNKKEDE
jgi:hypothetical protein